MLKDKPKAKAAVLTPNSPIRMLPLTIQTPLKFLGYVENTEILFTHLLTWQCGATFSLWWIIVNYFHFNKVFVNSEVQQVTAEPHSEVCCPHLKTNYLHTRTWWILALNLQSIHIVSRKVLYCMTECRLWFDWSLCGTTNITLRAWGEFLFISLVTMVTMTVHVCDCFLGRHCFIKSDDELGANEFFCGESRGWWVL